MKYGVFLLKPQSAKAKGRNLCKLIKKMLVDSFKLEEDDIKVTSSGATGEDLQFSHFVRKYVFPFQIEAKSRASFSGYKFLEQAEKHGKYTPIVVVKANNKKPLVLMDFEEFIKIIKELNEHQEIHEND